MMINSIFHFILLTLYFIYIFSRSQASIPVQNVRKYIVYETCIMELFESCPVCQGRCDVRSQTHGTFLRVDQVCQHCNFSRKWNSQPIMGSTPAGNIHLSCAVYLCGASYITVEKVSKGIILNVVTENTFLLPKTFPFTKLGK